MTINYLRLVPLFQGVDNQQWCDIFDVEIVPDWIGSYRQATQFQPDIISANVDGSDYVFDIALGRGIGSYCITAGKHSGPRPSSRMRGHPQSAGEDYHRGHLIAHTLGGRTDINLFSQRGRLNIGAFRRLERQAVKKVGVLYFVRLLYDRSSDSQLPNRIEQGLISDIQQPNIQVTAFDN